MLISLLCLRFGEIFHILHVHAIPTLESTDSMIKGNTNSVVSQIEVDGQAS